MVSSCTAPTVANRPGTPARRSGAPMKPCAASASRRASSRDNETAAFGFGRPDEGEVAVAIRGFCPTCVDSATRDVAQKAAGWLVSRRGQEHEALRRTRLEELEAPPLLCLPSLGSLLRRR